MHYYVKYFLCDEECRIKHFELNNEEKQPINNFIEQIKTDGCTSFCVKRSHIPMVSLEGQQNIFPFLNVANEEQFNALNGEDITSDFEK